MPVELKIAEQATQHLNAPASGELKACVERYAADLLGEANRLEAATKSTDGGPEITSTMIKDADILLRRGYRRPPKGRVLIVAQLVATVGGFLTGLFADAEKLKSPIGFSVFVLALALTVTATVVAVMKE